MPEGQAANINAAGPAGTRLEVQIAAHYLLAMLRGGEGRGLPGVRIARVKLQRGDEGHPLDDVIVVGHDRLGGEVTLEIQVKRSIAFTAQDPIFRKVVGQIAQSLRQFGQEDGRRLAIATSQHTRKIDGPLQDVLTWARQIGEAEVFVDRIGRPGSSNGDIRTFVDTLAAHLGAEGVDNDARALWSLLRRFQIMVFDYGVQGSDARALAHEQCLQALAPQQAGRAADLWAALTAVALEVDAAGGDRTREALLEDLRPHGFVLVGEREHAAARDRLSEASSNTLADIDDLVGDARLLRPARLAAVHAAFDEGRYVEIRGAGGVGKSGLLKHFALQAGEQGRIVALNPERTLPHGWTAMSAALGFVGRAEDFLVDLAASGSGLLVIDGVDNFSGPARATASDLIRAAAGVPGFRVLVTARTGFGRDDPSWLPTDALDQLGRAEPLIVEDLSPEEVVELRHAAPGLSSLLTEGHPAREVTRNLYRLRRLMAQSAEGSEIRTEVGLARMWWDTADGLEQGRRARRRVLTSIADSILAGVEPSPVENADVLAIDALVASQSLRETGADLMVFHHDVLRDWAMFCRLAETPVPLARLDLTIAPSPSLARGLELLARARLEQGDLAGWRALAAQTSVVGAHGAWRRGVLLALVRSEAALDALDLATEDLLIDGGRLLRDLIRLTQAIDSRPVSELVPQMATIAGGALGQLSAPSGPSWAHLIAWLIGLGERLPDACVPTALDLYTSWLQVSWGRGPLDAHLVEAIFGWLLEVTDDGSRGARASRDFGLDREAHSRLVETLKSMATSFADAAPSQASAYLSKLLAAKRGGHAADQVVKHAGRMPQAAPDLMAALTLRQLVETREPGFGERRKAFTFLDNQFIPESPARGPFLGLLSAAPARGLALLRELVAHAIMVGQDGESDAPDAGVTLVIDGVERGVTALWAYEMGRPLSSGGHALISGMMALEAWAHGRVEAGEPLADVLADILGEEPVVPAPFVLTAVDVLISHWSEAAAGLAVPFMGSPELLAIDCARSSREAGCGRDASRSGEEPGVAPMTAADLSQRPSRGVSLVDLAPQYTLGPEIPREEIVARLRAAAARLPGIEPHEDLRAPQVMARHALNVLDPDNWRSPATPEDDWQYVRPADDAAHLEQLTRRRTAHDPTPQILMAAAVGDPSRVTPELLASAVALGRAVIDAPLYAPGSPAGEDAEAQFRGAAALVLARDVDDISWPTVSRWVRDKIADGLALLEGFDRHGGGLLRYDVAAMAFVSLVHVIRREQRDEDLAALLRTAGSPRGGTVSGFAAAQDLLSSLDPRLARSLLRIALAVRVTVWTRGDEAPEVEQERRDARARLAKAAVEAELAWLRNDGPEPPWAPYPERRPRPRRGVRLPAALPPPEPPPLDEPEAASIEGAAPSASEAMEPQDLFDLLSKLSAARVVTDDEAEFDGEELDDEDDEAGAEPAPYVEIDTAADWIKALSDTDASAQIWRLDMIRAYADWTYGFNGRGQGRFERFDGNTRSWNGAFFKQLGAVAAHMTQADLEALLFEPLAALPDGQILEIAPIVLLSADLAYFGSSVLDDTRAVQIRRRVGDCVMNTDGWRRERGKADARLEVRLGPAIAALFFGVQGFGTSNGSYLRSDGIDRLDPFLPLLTAFTLDGRSLPAALYLLNTLEVAPRVVFLPLLVEAATCWIETFPEDVGFWSDYGVGKRLCRLLEAIAHADVAAMRGQAPRLGSILSRLVDLGIAEAGRLEAILGGGG